MDRRQFLTWVGVGAIAHSLPIALAACNPTEPTAPQADNSPGSPESPPAAASESADGFTAIATVEQLERQGSILDKKSAAQPILIARNPDNQEIAALNPTCTHRGCDVQFDGNAKVLSCPCHGSKFALDGQVLEGPATRPLASYEVKQENGSISVKVG